MEAELNCLRDLLNNSKPWSYALDMAGSEVMLATNRELVDSLDREAEEIYTASFLLPKNNENRIKFKFIPGQSVKEPQDPVPFNLTIYKGAKSWKLPRTFVSFLLTHPVAMEFLEWSRSTSLFYLIYYGNRSEPLAFLTRWLYPPWLRYPT